MNRNFCYGACTSDSRHPDRSPGVVFFSVSNAFHTTGTYQGVDKGLWSAPQAVQHRQDHQTFLHVLKGMASNFLGFCRRKDYWSLFNWSTKIILSTVFGYNKYSKHATHFCDAKGIVLLNTSSGIARPDSVTACSILELDMYVVTENGDVVTGHPFDSSTLKTGHTHTHWHHTLHSSVSDWHRLTGPKRCGTKTHVQKIHHSVVLHTQIPSPKEWPPA